MSQEIFERVQVEYIRHYASSDRFRKNSSPSARKRRAEKDMRQLQERLSSSGMRYHDLPQIVRGITLAKTRGKDSYVARMKEFAKICERYHLDNLTLIKFNFPPEEVIIDKEESRNSYITQYICLYGQTNVPKLSELLWVSEKTIEKDLKEIRSEQCGRGRHQIDVKTTRETLKLKLTQSQVHELIRAITARLKSDGKNGFLQSMPQDIWKQLSSYGREKAREYLDEDSLRMMEPLAVLSGETREEQVTTEIIPESTQLMNSLELREDGYYYFPSEKYEKKSWSSYFEKSGLGTQAKLECCYKSIEGNKEIICDSYSPDEANLKIVLYIGGKDFIEIKFDNIIHLRFKKPS